MLNFLIFKALRDSVNALYESMVYISNFFSTLLFMLIFFGILGLHLFMGYTENRCRSSPFPDGEFWPALSDYKTLCGSFSCPEK